MPGFESRMHKIGSGTWWPHLRASSSLKPTMLGRWKIGYRPSPFKDMKRRQSNRELMRSEWGRPANARRELKVRWQYEMARREAHRLSSLQWRMRGNTRLANARLAD